AAKALASEIKGKRVIVTGVTLGGMGAETARALASQGAEVILAARSSSKIKETADAIKKEFPNAKLKELVFDLNSQATIRKSAAEVLAFEGPVDVVILNAGVVRVTTTNIQSFGLISTFIDGHSILKDS
ncbi:hypothetical protein H0H93_003009, partial [Arthromyces matolae]